MTHSRQAGFSLIEVLIAITIFSVGVLAIASTHASTQRMLGDARRDGRIALLANDRLETLRRVAGQTTPRCTNLASGASSALGGGLSMTWTVTNPVTPKPSRNIQVIVTRTIRGRTSADSFFTVIGC